jgi:hypothetical protein
VTFFKLLVQSRLHRAPAGREKQSFVKKYDMVFVLQTKYEKGTIKKVFCGFSLDFSGKYE